ncbi:MAG TPA: tetratricopeptide repeat protein [Bryobacteraceae bacterium]|nr:tetratricopeptide repeat protein [Bryobacteraceae bacterium]
MTFWRKDVIDFALDHETAVHIREQKEWIAREPQNPRPWYNLAQLYRIERKPGEALALLLEAVRLDDACADAHVALTEIYAVRADYAAAQRHARKAAENGNVRGVELLRRHGVE